MKEFVSSYIDMIKQKYLQDPKEILEHYEQENSNIEDYNGRQLLEMIQNADDAAEASIEPKVLIYLSDDVLVIANNGTPFSEDGIDSILRSHLSPKVNQRNRIGYKGLGFRSILSWADKVEIKSSDLKISFSQANSEQFLQELIKKEPLIETEIVKRYKKFIPSIALLRCPKIETDINLPEETQDYDTIVKIKLKNGLFEIVNSHISENIDPEVMLFLNNLQYLEIITPQIKKTLKKKIIDTNKIEIETIVEGGSITSFWNILSRKGTREADLNLNREEKSFEMSIAWKDEIEDGKNLLHSFFRTNVPFNFPGIVHGTFLLNQSRNDLIDDEFGHNKFLFAEIAKLIADAAEIIAKSETTINYKALNFVNIDTSNIHNIIKSSGFKDILISKIKTKNVFPTISSKYVNYENKPVYYKNTEFAQLLPVSEFSNLLKQNSSEKLNLLLSELKLYKYSIDKILKGIINKRKEIGHDNYAKIIKLLKENYLDDESVKKIKETIFYDDDLNICNGTNNLFLPTDNTKYNLPKDLGISFINRDLSIALKKTFNVSEDSHLAIYLENYGVRAYNFDEIVGLTLRYYSRKEKTIENVKSLHTNLFELYKNELNPPIEWKNDSKIPFMNKKLEISNSNELYFGKEYGNELLETLYSFNKSKLISSKEYHSINSDNDKWMFYLKWAGVAELPRKIKYNGEIDYAKFCMKNYNFKHKIEDIYFSGYKEYENNQPYFSEIKVTTIDDIDNILLHNETETIFAWLNIDNEVLKSLENDIEPADSYLMIYFKNKVNPRNIWGKGLKNYLKWKLSNTAWINTESVIKQAPYLCTTSNTINEDFSPLIEKPLINKNANIFKHYPIKPDKFEYLFSSVGINKSISTFTTYTIYGILLKLPDIDPEGKKAKSIYRELANYYDEEQIDFNDENYLKYLKSGKVFCKFNKVNIYIPHQEAFYIENKRYGESIINQFCTIQIDRRRSKGRIKKIFQVAPLVELSLKLADEPELHPLSKSFDEEIYRFKPYVYVLRMDLDSSGADKNRIKDVKFKLVKKLSVNLIKKDNIQRFDLLPYEYVFIEDKQTIYVYTPELDTILSLQNDIQFCSAIADAFSSLIDVEAQRQQIRELFSKSPSSRDEIIRNEFDDSNLEKLIEARNKLGVINDPKTQFWEGFTRSLGKEALKKEQKTDSEYLDILINILPELKDTIKNMYNEINYDNYNEEASARRILDLIKKSNITIDHLNQFIYPQFDIKDIYSTDFNLSKTKYRNSFKSNLYSNCLQNKLPKKNFRKLIKEYDNLLLFSTNTNYDTDIELLDKVNELFGISIEQVEVMDEIDRLYSTNKETLLNKNPQIFNINLLEQFLLQNEYAESLLYFNDEIDNVYNSYMKWIESNSGANGGDIKPDSKKINFGNKSIIYSNYKELKNQLDVLIDQSKSVLEKIKIKKVELSNKKGMPKRDKTMKKPKKPSEEIGFVGEYVVYRYLKENIEKKDDVKWVSDYARKADVNIEGEDGRGYDFVYIPNGAKYERYVEVKVVGKENSFHITANEVKEGEKLKKNYELFLVRNITDPEHIIIECIQGPFDYKKEESFSNNNRFLVTNDSFVLKYDIDDD